MHFQVIVKGYLLVQFVSIYSIWRRWPNVKGCAMNVTMIKLPSIMSMYYLALSSSSAVDSLVHFSQ